jgi:hypothetical protein
MKKLGLFVTIVAATFAWIIASDRGAAPSRDAQANQINIGLLMKGTADLPDVTPTDLV